MVVEVVLRFFIGGMSSLTIKWQLTKLKESSVSNIGNYTCRRQLETQVLPSIPVEEQVKIDKLHIGFRNTHVPTNDFSFNSISIDDARVVVHSTLGPITMIFIFPTLSSL